MAADQRSSTGLLVRYTTPEQIRCIPNTQWEEWISTDTLPFNHFSAERHCQQTLRTIIKATRRRMGQ